MDAQAIPLKTTVNAFRPGGGGGLPNPKLAGKPSSSPALVLLLCASNALNVVDGYVSRNFMTAIADRDMSGFVRQAFVYVSVFAALTLVAVIARFGEERLGLLLAPPPLV